VYPSDVYAGCADVRLDTDYLNENLGGETQLAFGIYSGYRTYRTLIKFDMSPVIPANVTVNKAILTIYSNSAAGATTLTAYALTQQWNEGNGIGGGTADTLTGATWNSSVSGGSPVAWPTPGADGAFNAGTAGSETITVPASTGFISMELNAEMVQSWVSNPSSNYGVIIKAVNETTPNNRFWIWSSEYTTDPLKRPKLTLYYTLP
jgi:hypothetical protein